MDRGERQETGVDDITAGRSASVVHGCLVAREGAYVVYAVDDEDWEEGQDLRGRVVEIWAAEEPEDFTNPAARFIAQLGRGA